MQNLKKLIKSIYDNGGKTVDRYTIVFKPDFITKGGYHVCLGLSENPEDPSHGFSQFGECIPGPHLGKKIKFQDLPSQVAEHIKRRLEV